MRDLRHGIEASRFDVPDPGIALAQAGSALLAVMRAVLDGRAKRNAAQHHAAGVLRLLGLDPADAAEVAARPQPLADAR